MKYQIIIGLLAGSVIAPDYSFGQDPQAKRNTNSWTIAGREFEKSRSINAVEFGLVAGTDADQTLALTKAISHAADSAEIDTVYIPAGVYKFKSSIWLRSEVNLIGDGADKTVLQHTDPGSYLLRGKRLNCRQAVVANLSLRNDSRTVLMWGIRDLQFHRVEFVGGIVRFEQSSGIQFIENVFRENRGKSAYAGSKCQNVTIVNNDFHSIEHGSINLSGHEDCYVAGNVITAEKPIDSGYAGIRLPNRAKKNLVERNYIANHARGIFILSSSENNTVRNNLLNTTTYEGVFVQSSKNTLEGNTIIDAGSQGIYVVNAGAASSPTPSIADENTIRNNIITDTRPHDGSRNIGLQVFSKGNTITGNIVSKEFGREFLSIRKNSNNQERENIYQPRIEPVDIKRWVRECRVTDIKTK